MPKIARFFPISGPNPSPMTIWQESQHTLCLGFLFWNLCNCSGHLQRSVNVIASGWRPRASSRISYGNDTRLIFCASLSSYEFIRIIQQQQRACGAGSWGWIRGVVETQYLASLPWRAVACPTTIIFVILTTLSSIHIIKRVTAR